jgi:tetratricopeptide (TPR) repeat protein
MLAASLLFVTCTAHAKTANDIYQQAAKSTVIVENINDNGGIQAMGSGVVLADGYVVTNCHVIKSANHFKVRIGGRELPASLRYSDWDRDICSLSVAGLIARAVVIGSTKMLKVGSKVYAIGAPQGLELSLSEGIVSNLRVIDGGQYIQTTAAISPGSSGGGLFDENGALVGLTTFYLTEGQNLNFAVPVEWVKELPRRSAKATTTPNTAQPVTQWLNESSELTLRKDWPALLEHSLRWAKEQPSSGEAWNNLGITYIITAHEAQAIEAFQHALRINPNDDEALLNLGAAYQSASPNKSVEIFQKLLRKNTYVAKQWVWSNLGGAYDKVGRSTDAIKAYQKALSISSDFAGIWFGLGNAYFKASQPNNAAEAYQQALRIDQDDPEIWIGLGNVYEVISQPSKAMEAFQQALRINPENQKAWYNLGNNYFYTGLYTKAIEAYQQALRINPEYTLPWVSMGSAYANTGQWPKAFEAYQQALNLNPKDHFAWTGLGNLYDDSGQTTKAFESYQQALRINPKYAVAWYNMGSAASKIGQRGKVLEVYKRLKTLDPALAEKYFSKFVVH